ARSVPARHQRARSPLQLPATSTSRGRPGGCALAVVTAIEISWWRIRVVLPLGRVLAPHVQDPYRSTERLVRKMPTRSPNCHQKNGAWVVAASTMDGGAVAPRRPRRVLQGAGPVDTRHADR